MSTSLRHHRVDSTDAKGNQARYAYDLRGLRTEKVTILTTPQGSFTSITRYQFDDSGVLQSTTLPDGSHLAYERNGQGQMVALKRERILTSWLRWAAPAQTIVRDLQRDIVGLKRYTTGNGIESEFQRSRDGSLARVVYRQVKPPPLQAADNTKVNTTAALPGALSLPQDPRAFMDHRYLWDSRGNLLYTQSNINHSPTQDSYAYDGKDRLVAAVSPNSVSRYLYDAANRRVLSQQGIQSQDDTRSNTLKTSYQPGTHRWAGNLGEGSADNARNAGSKPANYDANGQPQTIGQREYVWDALGKLTTIREQDKTLASYRYNHRGERVGKSVGDQTQGFLYDNQQLIGELNANGQLTRQYIYLADQPTAVIDTPQGQALHKPDASAFADIVHDLQTIGSVWFSHDNIVWLHTNHLGATEAATDDQGKLIWQARYAPFGQANIRNSSSNSGGHGFTLNLRLPGQYADAETGLHYNRQRYYDPERGQYLTPDPMGTPNGPNGYAYVRYNPLKYVDPDGLVLFAFDGTENSNPVLYPGVDTLSNVVEFQRLYLSDNRDTRYISGVGTVDISDPNRPILAPDGSFGHLLTPDKGFNYSGPARITRMVEYFGTEAGLAEDNTAMEVDIIGFSRGAAEARDFANQIAAKTTNGWYSYTVQDSSGNDVAKCQKVDFRFMGLWDTVLSKNNSGHNYSLGIPDQFRYVSQAVALNEFRGNIFSGGRPDPTNLDSIGEFPLESIMGSPVPIGKTRIEKGFLGSHSDIGGGFTNNDLSTVALAWMVQQAKDAGVTMEEKPINIADTAVLHDKSNNIQTGAPNPRTIFGGSEDRIVRYRDGTTTTQRAMTGTGMTFTDTNKFILYADRASLATSGGNFNRNGELINNNIMTNVTGTVDMAKYVQWLKASGYNLGNVTGAGSK